MEVLQQQSTYFWQFNENESGIKLLFQVQASSAFKTKRYVYVNFFITGILKKLKEV